MSRRWTAAFAQIVSNDWHMDPVIVVNDHEDLTEFFRLTNTVCISYGLKCSSIETEVADADSLHGQDVERGKNE